MYAISIINGVSDVRLLVGARLSPRVNQAYI